MGDRINITWTIPFVMPFVFLALSRAIFWCAGATWSEPDVAAVLSLFAGPFLGLVFIITVFNDNPITIRKWWIK